MNVCVDAAYQSLNKHHEELCGDKVEILSTKDSDIIILADGMGSGVKANILATLTSKILGTMFRNGASLADCVQTIAKTLPVCKVREVAYSTFSILQVFHDGNAYLVEFDNPCCVYLRSNQIMDLPFEEVLVEGKNIRESRFTVRPGDTFVLMSDGVINAGIGTILNYGWTRDSMAEYTAKVIRPTHSASRLSSLLIKACDDLYMQSPGDDTTIAVARIITKRHVRIFTGPPTKEEYDEAAVRELMAGDAYRIVSGGTTAKIVSRILNKPILPVIAEDDSHIPPMSQIDGIDLVTEGVLTLSHTLQLMKQYSEDAVTEEFFLQLDHNNGASKLAKILIENCTHLDLIIGKTINSAHQDPGIPADLSVRMNIVRQLAKVAKDIGKEVTVTYY